MGKQSKIEEKHSFDNNINNSCGNKQALSSITGKSSISTLYIANLELIKFHYFFPDINLQLNTSSKIKVYSKKSYS